MTIVPKLSPRDEARVALAQAARTVADIARGLVPTVPDQVGDPASPLRDVLTLQSMFVSFLESRALVASREAGATWDQIGEAAAMTRQSAHERWAPVEQAWKEGGRKMLSRGHPVDAQRTAADLDQWYARGRDGGDHIVTGPRGVRAVTDGLDVAGGPSEGEWTTDRPDRPKTITGMRQSLHHHTNHDFGDGALRYLLAFPPVDLLADALEQGWEAPQVRAQLLDALSRHLRVGRPWPADADEATQDLALAEMIAADRKHPGNP